MQRSAKLGLQPVESATRWMAAGTRVDSRPGTGASLCVPQSHPEPGQGQPQATSSPAARTTPHHGPSDATFAKLN